MEFFKDTSTDKDSFFQQDTVFIPPLVDEEKAVERAGSLSLTLPAEVRPDTLKSIATANIQNTQSTEELQMIAQTEQDRLEAVASAAESIMMEDPSVENIDAYNEVREQILAIEDYSFKTEEGVRQLMSNMDTPQALEKRLENHNRWLESSAEISKIH